MSRLSLIWKILTRKKARTEPFAVEKAQESVRCRALQRQVDTLEEINLQYSEQIKAMGKELANHREGNFQDKMLDIASNWILNKNQTPSFINKGISDTPVTSGSPALALESGVCYSDSDLITLAESLPKGAISSLKQLSFNKFAEVIKAQVPNISDESVKRSRDILEAML